MNKFILIILFSISLFGQNINEHKIDLYFGNGIMTNYAQAVDTGNDLAQKIFNKNIGIRNKLFQTDIVDNIENVNSIISYNHSFGIANDVFESIFQKTGTNWDLIENFVSNRDEIIDIINNSEALSPKEKTYLLFIFSSDNYDSAEILDEMYKVDLKNQIDRYKKSISEGHRIMLVAHSQGTLFGNDSYNSLEKWEKQYFDMYGIGAAASQILGDYDKSNTNYFSNKTDPLAGIEIDKYLEIFPNSFTYGLSYYLKYKLNSDVVTIGLEANNELTEMEKEVYNINLENSDFFAGHFIKNYLQIPRARNIILDKVEDKVNKLSKIESQYSAEYTENRVSIFS